MSEWKVRTRTVDIFFLKNLLQKAMRLFAGLVYCFHDDSAGSTQYYEDGTQCLPYRFGGEW